MQLSLIVAMASNRAIGLNNQLPWHLSADLKRFKHLTMGYPILMGRKTYESIGHPLPGRTNLVISRNPHYQPEGCLVFNDVAPALSYGKQYPKLFVIGGSSLYECLLEDAQVIYLTMLHQPFEGDTFFPELAREQWEEIERIDVTDDPKVSFSYSFITLMKRAITDSGCTFYNVSNRHRKH